MDLNGDGYRDILSGSWPGEIFLFQGGKDGTFAAPEMIRYKDGEIINIGGGIQERPNGGILITGNGKFEQTSEGMFVDYHGKRLESTPQKPISITGTASAVHGVDWDGDGDLDLIIGTIEGKVYLVPNEGTTTSYAFGKEQALQAGGKSLQVDSNAGPHAADWDGDGDLDLLVGSGDGSVALFRNTGTAESPELAAPEELVPPGVTAYGSEVPKEPRRGNRSKICTADWNGDGRLDLLVGDYTSQKPDLPEPTPEEKKEQDRIRRELESINVPYGELAEKLFGDARDRTKEEHDKLHEELGALREKMADLRSKLPSASESHGWIWLFLRKDEKSKEKAGS